MLPIAGSVVGCILMQQLDYWFERHPDGFYKFLEPVDHEAYKPGESWTEELGITKAEFRTAFDRIGVRYVSKGQLIAAGPDKFQGRYYCSYFDNKSYCTQYFRNHELLDAALDAMIFPEMKKVPMVKKSSAANQESESAANQESESAANQESESPYNEQRLQDLQILKTTTTEVTNSTPDKEPGSCCVVDLVFPKAISDPEKIALAKILDGCAASQEILDEIEGALANKTCKSILAFGLALHKAWVNGTFVPALGVARLGRI